LTGLKPMAASSFRPLDDQPLDEDSARVFEADYRLQPLRGQLLRLLRPSYAGETAADGAAPRIGLFGGLGQGKTSLVDLCLADLEKADREFPYRGFLRRGRWGLLWRDFCFGPRVARFNVSDFKADDLEWRFFTTVLWHRVLGRLALGVLPLFVLLIFLISQLTVISAWWELRGCVQSGWFICSHWGYGVTLVLLSSPWLVKIIAGFTPLFKTGKTLHEFDPGKGLYLAARDRLIHLLARWTGTLPRIVIIDDLDRARVEQQRAFLRALLRYARQMGFALLVCMDERELLAAPADPESPEELLRKVIQFELRLPERGAEDVLWLARSCCRQLAGQNDDPWPGLLDDPRWLANLLRCLLLLGPPADCSPRQVKRLLNDLLLRAEQLQLRTADDCCALLRLECLYRLSPELRRQGERLLPALESNRRSDFARVLRDAGIAATQQEALGRFFARTRMLQPAVKDGWFRLLGGLPAPAGDEAAAVPDDVRLPDSAFGARGHELLRLYLGNLTYLAQGYAATLDLQADAEFPQDGSSARPASPATGEAQAQAIWKFPLPGGSDEKFSPAELGEFLCQLLSFFWPLLIAALTPADARQRAPLPRRGGLATRAAGARAVAAAPGAAKAASNRHRLAGDPLSARTAGRRGSLAADAAGRAPPDDGRLRAGRKPPGAVDADRIAAR